jgi:hypothetical protein
MIGNFNLPIAKGNAKTYVYTAINTTATTNPWRGFYTWNKPKGINFVYGLIIGGGSGGGGGFSIGAGTTGGGGGGGTPGAVIQFIQPAYLVPDTLSVSVSIGGTGGAANTSGGFPALVSGLWYPLVGQTTLSITRIYYAFSNSNLGGTQSGRTGTGAAGGNGGAASTLSATSNQPGIMGFSNYSLPAALSGFAGTLVAGTNATFAGRPQGGAGGGGVTSGVAAAGGNVLGPTTSEQSIWSRNLSGGAATGQAGENGITLFEPTLFSLPGAGGGANASGTGGAGGKGGIGCGGGGGGAGTTGGRGGDGGDGLVILVCW